MRAAATAPKRQAPRVASVVKAEPAVPVESRRVSKRLRIPKPGGSLPWPDLRRRARAHGNQGFDASSILPVVMLVIAALILFKAAEHTLTQSEPGGGAQALGEAETPAEDATEPESEEEVLDPEATGEFVETDDTEEANEAEAREFTSAEREVLESLLARRQQLEAREREVQLREKLLEAAEKRVEERVAELKTIEERIEQSFGKQEEERKAQLQNLVSMYENMKPKDAARIFDRLDMTVLLGVVQQMKTRKMAPISGEDGFRGGAAPDGRVGEDRRSAYGPMTGPGGLAVTLCNVCKSHLFLNSVLTRCDVGFWTQRTRSMGEPACPA